MTKKRTNKVLAVAAALGFAATGAISSANAASLNLTMLNKVHHGEIGHIYVIYLSYVILSDYCMYAV